MFYYFRHIFKLDWWHIKFRDILKRRDTERNLSQGRARRNEDHFKTQDFMNMLEINFQFNFGELKRQNKTYRKVAK